MIKKCYRFIICFILFSSYESYAKDVVLAVASDIQTGLWSKSVKFEKTARVIESINPDYVVSAGDLSNSLGTEIDYTQFDKAWGRFKSKILAVPGNHDYALYPNAEEFFDYFVGRRRGLPIDGNAGPRGKGYFAMDIGSWLVIGLNWYAEGHGFKQGDRQLVWLDTVMQTKPKGKPVLFYAHPPRYTRVGSGMYENAGNIDIVWDVMLKYAPDVKIYIGGHANGNYERWKPMNNNKQEDVYGIRSFLVATGGASPYPKGEAGGLLESVAQTYGVMKLVLREDGYDWEYKAIPGCSFKDLGSVGF